MNEIQRPNRVGEGSLAVLSLLVGQEIVRIERIRYMGGARPLERGEVEGWIQLQTKDKSILLRQAPNGYELLATLEKWRDPFPLPWSEEDKAYIAQYGRLEAMDVSTTEPFRRLVRNTVTDIHALREERGFVYGADIAFADAKLRVWVEADEFSSVVEEAGNEKT